MPHDTPPLIIIGGGPKAAAISAKSRILRDYGNAAPPVLIIDNKDLAAHWNGHYGFTNGSQRLGTPPEKDIGFPYRIDTKDDRVTKELFSRYSWLSYNIFKKRRFGEWIDRGRLHPTHREWSEYITWVIKGTADKICIGNISCIKPHDTSWRVHLSKKDGYTTIYDACGIVITGPGSRKTPESISVPQHRFILYGDDFWQHLDTLNHISSGDDAPPIAVIGGGETAASIVSYLIEFFGNRKVSILVFTRTGTIFSRGEGYYENRMFTEHQTWKSLPSTVRREVIKRGDRGVFSIDAAKKLAFSHNIDHRFLEVTSIDISKADNNILLINKYIECQMIILALGFDPFSFGQMFSEDIRDIIKSPKEQSNIEESINHDLSVNHPGIRGKLFLPMISAFTQGPGFPNLSCLGTLSDRILGRD